MRSSPSTMSIHVSPTFVGVGISTDCSHVSWDFSMLVPNITKKSRLIDFFQKNVFTEMILTLLFFKIMENAFQVLKNCYSNYLDCTYCTPRFQRCYTSSLSGECCTNLALEFICRSWDPNKGGHLMSLWKFGVLNQMRP